MEKFVRKGIILTAIQAVSVLGFLTLQSYLPFLLWKIWFAAGCSFSLFVIYWAVKNLKENESRN